VDGAVSQEKRVMRRPDRAELTPLSFIERAARAYGARTAIVSGDRRITYREMRDRVHRLASALRRVGIMPGEPVAILAPNGPALLESHFGIPLAGAVLVPINTRLAPPEIAYILGHCGARVLLVDAQLAGILPALRAQCPGLNIVITIADADAGAASVAPDQDYERFLETGSTEAGAPPFDSEDDPISINYTSGTTGTPKGVVCTHRGAFLNALSVAFETRMGPDSVYLWTLPMFHCNGWCFTWGATAAGATHVVLRRVDPEVVWPTIERDHVTHLCAAPTVLIALANHPSASTVSWPLRVATGGAPPSPTTIAQLASLGIDVTHLYGMTETYGPSLACAWWPEWDALPLEEQARIKARQGVPHVGVAGARVIDDELRDVPADAKTLGELVFRGNTVMRGYFNDDEATAEAFRGDWFHTGDLGVVHPDGYIELRDRAKDVIISGGENISTIEVEQALIRHPAVLEAAVIGVPDERWGEVPKAFVTLKPGMDTGAQELVAHCHKLLARFKAPKSVEFGELPKTSTGKIQKFVLREREWAGREKRIN
jgi:fatty-acyl-CoA synthase